MSPDECDKDFFYDKNVYSCQPCQDVCSPPEIDENLCRNQCKEFLATSSVSTQSVDGVTHVILWVSCVSSLLIFIILVLIAACYLRRVCKKKKKKRSSTPWGQSGAKTFEEGLHYRVSSAELPRIPSLQHNSSQVESLYAFQEDPQISVNGVDLILSCPGEDSVLSPSTLGDQYFHRNHSGSVSLRSSVVEPMNLNEDGGKKPFFRAVTEQLSNLPYFKRAWMDGSVVKVGLSKEDFTENRAFVMERLERLNVDYRSEGKKVDVTCV